MDVVQGEGVRLILYLQNAFSGFSNAMLFLSRVGDPKNSFMVYFPVAFYLDRAMGLMVIWVAIISEWLNLILKWILRGERPYWWVNEMEQWRDVQLSQYPLTCETGPGSPSGHSMVTTAVLFTMLPMMIDRMCELLKLKPSKELSKTRLVDVMMWLLFLVIVTLVSLSRVFIATHFPHQVIGGVLGGVVLSCIAQKYLDILNLTSVLKCGIVSMIITFSTLGFYEILLASTFDPSESVQKAQKWCSNPAYISIETRPFYALVRDAGSAFGVGLAHWFVSFFESNEKNANNLFLANVVKIVISISMIQFLDSFKPSFSNDTVFYLFGFTKNAAFVVIVIFVVPTISAFVTKNTRNKSKHH